VCRVNVSLVGLFSVVLFFVFLFCRSLLLIKRRVCVVHVCGEDLSLVGLFFVGLFFVGLLRRSLSWVSFVGFVCR